MILLRSSIASMLFVCLAAAAQAQVVSYPDPTLHYIYPAGARQGTMVKVRLGHMPVLTGAKEIVIDGPPGITAADLARTGDEFGATLTIAPDALPGRRLLRVLGGSSGLTSFRYFFVGRLPELIEKESNDTPATAEVVALPAVVNGRIQADLDVDCFAFEVRAGEQITAAVLAHGMDSAEYSGGGTAASGFVDITLELLDEQGKIMAAASDTLGLDPVLEFQAPAAGRYAVRLQSTSLRGSLASVYRLTLGDIPYPTHVFPAGGRRGEQVQVEVGGLHLTEPLRQAVSVAQESFRVQYLADMSATSDGRDLPLVRGDHLEVVEAEPNNDATHSQSLELPVTANGRFESAGDEDWYRLSLQKGETVLLDVMAERVLRSPIDTLLEVYDAAGKKLAENDDGRLFARPNHCDNDFSSADSWLQFKATADGEYRIRLTNQGGTPGPRAIYRLTATPLTPDFLLDAWPDAVPVWGPGATACFVVEMRHFGGLKSEIQIRVEGLPERWLGSTVRLSPPLFETYQPPNGLKVLLAVTAPADAEIGTMAPLRVIGRAEQDGTVIEHEARYLTLYGNSHNDGMLLRASPAARAVVAPPLDCRLSTAVRELSARRGETIQVPIKIERSKAGTPLGLVVNGPTVAVGCGMAPPTMVSGMQDEFLLPLTINREAALGRRSIVVARSWSSDLRSGRPGPCTQMIELDVLPADTPK